MSSRHSRHAARRSPWRPLAAAALGASVLLIGGQGVWASLNATATNATPQSVTSGNLTLTMAATGVGLTQAIGNLAPGDTVNRHVVLTNGGTLATSGLSLGIASNPTSSALLADNGAAKGLQITVNACSVAWTATTGACGGTRTTALSARALSTLAGSTAALSNVATGVGDKSYLQISLQLPDQDEVSVNGVAPGTTVQNQTISLTYTFTAAQRAATTTNS